jgi:hypothetical protein
MQLNLTANDKYNLKLLQITENGNFPHYYFAEILQRAKDAHLNGFNFSQIVHDRSTILYRFRKRFLHLPQCTTADIQLESLQLGARETARVVFWSAVDIIQNLFFDREIFGNLDNCMCNQSAETRFHPYVMGPDDYIGEGITGEWYEKNNQMLIDDPEVRFNKDQDFFIPLCGACDRTHVEASGRHGVIPFTLTTYLIRRVIRNHPRAWRHLGLLPDLQK